jgi:hypothetical protein
MKKILACVASALLAVTVSMTAFAASGISANEQAVLDKLKAPITVGDKTLTLPAEYYNQAENYLKQDGVDVTDEQKAVINAQIDEAVATVKASGVTDLAKLPSDVKSKLMTNAQTAAKELDLTLTFDNSNKTITVKDKSGNVVAKIENVIKTTGADTTVAVVTAATLVALLAGCAVVARKSKLMAK